MMAASVDPLVVGRVIGDVVDMFIPSVGMSVYFGPKHVTNGCDIKPSMAINPPKVTLTGNMDNLYTLVSHSISLILHAYMHIIKVLMDFFNNFVHAGYD